MRSVTLHTDDSKEDITAFLNGLMAEDAFFHISYDSSAISNPTGGQIQNVDEDLVVRKKLTEWWVKE